MRHLTVTVPQGVGDIFWCYQKLAPHCDKISFKIGVTRAGDNIQARSESIIATLPKVVSVELKLLNSTEYLNLINGNYDLPSLLAASNEFNYSLNKQLDSGVRLEDMDNLPVQYDIELPLEPIELPEKYVIFYVSGTTSNRRSVKAMRLWDFEQWAKIINTIKCPVYVVGASFDIDAVNQITSRCHNAIPFVQQKPERLFYLIKHAHLFVGYQSGLSVLADNLGVRHLIVYFDHLPKMKDSWAHPIRRETHFNYCYFKDGIKKALEICNT